ncbi:DUF2797 domain-containing protein [Catenulispora yoronensis]
MVDNQAVSGVQPRVPAPAPAADRLCTGLSWFEERPALTAVEGGDLRLKALMPGTRLALTWSGRRRCVGWTAPGTGRTACADDAGIDTASKLAQCPACQSRDHGLAVARDRVTDDGRTYQLYLAWFAPGMLKVGITAEQRGVARLLEQGAIGYTLIATGPLPAIRRAELTLSSAGLAKERYRSRAKVEAWWALPETDGLRSALTEARTRALRILADHSIDPIPDGPIIDNTAFFGLADGAPATYHEVEALEESGTGGRGARGDRQARVRVGGRRRAVAAGHAVARGADHRGGGGGRGGRGSADGGASAAVALRHADAVLRTTAF